MFHNDCLDKYCETYQGNVVCPVCRSDIGHSCMDVWAFKEKALGSPDGKPLFDSEHISNIYNSQKVVLIKNENLEEEKVIIKEN